MGAMELDMLLNEVYRNMQSVFGNRLISVILYGSYARGDYDQESDIDIAILADATRGELKKYHHELVSQMTHFMMEYGVLVSFTEIPVKDFEEYKDTLPYYRSIAEEGVRLRA